jgi:hypothetical protein
VWQLDINIPEDRAASICWVETMNSFFTAVETPNLTLKIPVFK